MNSPALLAGTLPMRIGGMHAAFVGCQGAPGLGAGNINIFQTVHLIGTAASAFALRGGGRSQPAPNANHKPAPAHSGLSRQKKINVYAVLRGWAPGVYASRAECRQQTRGFVGALFKKLDASPLLLPQQREFLGARTTMMAAAAPRKGRKSATTGATPAPADVEHGDSESPKPKATRSKTVRSVKTDRTRKVAAAARKAGAGDGVSEGGGDGDKKKGPKRNRKGTRNKSAEDGAAADTVAGGEPGQEGGREQVLYGEWQRGHTVPLVAGGEGEKKPSALETFDPGVWDESGKVASGSGRGRRGGRQSRGEGKGLRAARGSRAGTSAAVAGSDAGRAAGSGKRAPSRARHGRGHVESLDAAADALLAEAGSGNAVEVVRVSGGCGKVEAGGFLKMWIDGASRGNPGLASYGVLITDGNGIKVREISRRIGQHTNNVAEWQAACEALRAARELQAARVEVSSDSKLVVEQLMGRWQVKHAHLRPYCATARELAKGFEHFEIKWVRREDNKVADGLANHALDFGDKIWEYE